MEQVGLDERASGDPVNPIKDPALSVHGATTPRRSRCRRSGRFSRAGTRIAEPCIGSSLNSIVTKASRSEVSS